MKGLQDIETESIRGASLPPGGILIDTENHLLLRRLGCLFSLIFKRDHNCEFVELGCAPGGFLIYFYKKFGYKVTGVELIKDRAVLAEENLRINGVPGIVINKDIFDLDYRKLYDIVFSYGLLEHFKNYKKAMDIHYNLLKKGGILVLGVPNYNYLNKIILKIFNPYYIRTHNLGITNLVAFQDLFREYDFKTFFLGYFGTFYLDIYGFPWFTNPKNGERLIRTHAFLTRLLKNVKFESRFISPTLCFIGKKL